MRSMLVASIAASLLLACAPLEAQFSAVRERARVPYLQGLESMKSEDFAEAARLFRESTVIDPSFEWAFYQLGRSNMALKRFIEATVAYEKCRDLYLDQGSREFSSQQEAQRYRADRILQLDEQIRQLQAMPQTIRVQDMLRQVQNARRDTEERANRGRDYTLDTVVPAWVSVALGSAYFRQGKLLDAEREYRAAIDADPKAGEAHSNLAVVYMETKRFDEAERAVKAAEKAGFRVLPELKDEIRRRKAGR